jgi:hypothetical protein
MLKTGTTLSHIGSVLDILATIVNKNNNMQNFVSYSGNSKRFLYGQMGVVIYLNILTRK